VHLNQAQFHDEVAHTLQCFLGVAVPQEMLHALQALRYVGPGFWTLRLQALGLLLQHCQPHRDVEPIDPVFAERMQVFLHSAHILAPIRQEHHLLVLLHALRFHHFP
jgi:hypothetical protein